MLLQNRLMRLLIKKINWKENYSMRSWSCFSKKRVFNFVSTAIKSSSIQRILMKCALKTNFSLSFMEFKHQITSTILNGTASNSFSSSTRKECNGTQSTGRYGDDRSFFLVLLVSNILLAMNSIDVRTIQKSLIFHFAQMWECIRAVRVKLNDLKILIR